MFIEQEKTDHQQDGNKKKDNFISKHICSVFFLFFFHICVKYV